MVRAAVEIAGVEAARREVGMLLAALEAAVSQVVIVEAAVSQVVIVEAAVGAAVMGVVVVEPAVEEAVETAVVGAAVAEVVMMETAVAAAEALVVAAAVVDPLGTAYSNAPQRRFIDEIKSNIKASRKHENRGGSPSFLTWYNGGWAYPPLPALQKAGGESGKWLNIMLWYDIAMLVITAGIFRVCTYSSIIIVTSPFSTAFPPPLIQGICPQKRGCTCVCILNSCSIVLVA